MVWAREDIQWVAGYFEGEGCLFHGSHNKWFIQIGSTDLDVLEKVQSKLGLGKIYGPYKSPDPKRSSYKPIHQWRLTGVPKVYAVCVALYQFLGNRRQARFMEFFEHFRIHKKIKRTRDKFGRYWVAA